MDETSAVLLRRCRPIVERHHQQTERALIEEIDGALARHTAQRIAADRLFALVRAAPALPFIRSRAR